MSPADICTLELMSLLMIPVNIAIYLYARARGTIGGWLVNSSKSSSHYRFIYMYVMEYECCGYLLLYNSLNVDTE